MKKYKILIITISIPLSLSHIYILSSTDSSVSFYLELISVARQARFPNLWSKPGWLKRQSEILPLSHEETNASEGNLNGCESQLLLFIYIS